MLFYFTVLLTIRSPCSVTCGRGKKKRFRNVLEEGDDCPSTREFKTCGDDLPEC